MSFELVRFLLTFGSHFVFLYCLLNHPPPPKITILFPALNQPYTYLQSLLITINGDNMPGIPFPSVRVVIFIGLFLLVLIGISILLAFQDGRRTLKKFFYLAKSTMGVEVGWGGLIRLTIFSALPAIMVAFSQGYGDSQRKVFDWQAFWTVLIVITVIGLVTNLLNDSMTFKRILSPGAGHVWRESRKTATSAILKRINLSVGKKSVPVSEVRGMLTDLLDVIVLHVRDHRGSFRKDRPDVFASILLNDVQELIVVARNSISSTPNYERRTPVKYSKSGMLCARAIEAKKPLSVGVLTDVYPEGSRTKPYTSILAIPLFSSDDKHVYGALSIDSSRPYFFDSFVSEKIENDLENSLQPYIQMITLVLETLIDRDPQVVLASLCQPPENAQ